MFTLTRTVVLSFNFVSGQTNGAVTYAAIKPVRLVIYPSKLVGVQVSSLNFLAAGGRSSPLSFYLEFSPFKQMTVGIYQLGRIPDKMGIFPQQLVFKPGEKEHFFWVSTDLAAKGSQGSLVFTLTGDTKSVYNFPKRQKNFFLYTGRAIPPVILNKRIVGPTKDKFIQVEMITDSYCTCYFAVYPRGTLDVTFLEIRNKKLRYDNFQGKYKFGEYVDSNSQHRIAFTIPDIEDDLDQVLKIFVQNSEGVMADAVFYYFTTKGPETPMKVYLQVSSDSNQGAIINALKGGIASGARLTTTQPDTGKYFEQLSNGQTATPIPYPSTSLTADLEAKLSSFNSGKLKQETIPKVVTLNQAATLAASMNTSTGIGDLEEIQSSNQKDLILEDRLNRGLSETAYKALKKNADLYQTKQILPLVKGQDLTALDK